MKISDEAVEAAAKALDPQTMGSGGALAEKFKEQTRDEARRILEAAGPYMSDAEDDLLATVWTQAYHAGFQEAAGFGPTTNPYRSQA